MCLEDQLGAPDLGGPPTRGTSRVVADAAAACTWGTADVGLPRRSPRIRGRRQPGAPPRLSRVSSRVSLLRGAPALPRPPRLRRPRLYRNPP